MAEKKIEDWLNTAVSGIRFKPDRAAVEKELREHLEDKIKDLQRFYHLAWEEAEEMALGQMGDAAEIGREMAKIHKPWLGYLWRVTQVLLGVSVILLLLTFDWRSDRPVSHWPEEEPVRPGFSCEDMLELGQYQFQVEEAYWEKDETGQGNVTIVWKVTTPVFWEELDYLPGYFWSAEDDQGNQYYSYYGRYCGDDWWGDRITWDHPEEDGLGWCVELTVPEVPEDIGWLRLTYEGSSEPVSVVLEREVAQ